MPRTNLRLAPPLGHEAADRRIEILRCVGRCGSISQAAREVGVSYKAAWQALDTLSNLAGAPLVERQVGGTGGGGARLSAPGVRLLAAADEIARARQQALARLDGVAPAVGALSLRTSMRNQLPCTVVSLSKAAPLASVTLGLAGGAQLTARLTAESVELLALVPGQPVLALCKAAAVRVARADPAAMPVLNRLPGRATRVTRGPAAVEVTAQLEGEGPQVVGFAEPGGGLRTGSRVCVTVDPAAVVIALPG